MQSLLKFLIFIFAFQNLCAVAYNDLEPRVHGLVEQAENDGFETFGGGRAEHSDRIMDYLNTIKLLRAVGDTRTAALFLEKVRNLIAGEVIH